MIVSFLITFRETLEAALIIGIVLAYLSKTKNSRFNNLVYTAVFAGIVASIGTAFIFNSFAGGFDGRYEQIFEGITMLLGSFLLTTMILWMMRQKDTVLKLKEKVSKSVSSKNKSGIFFLVFLSVLREGVETVLFLGAANFVSKDNNIIGGLLGIIAAAFLGYLIFIASIKVNIKRFFNISSFFLILFAAGLVSHGIHEFEEANILPPIVEHVWDLNPDAPLSGQGIYPIFHEDGSIGSIAKGLFGYNGSPSLLEVLSYLFYLLFITILYKCLKITSP